MSPRTTTASGASASTTARIVGVSESTSAVLEVEAVGGVVQPELVDEDLRQLVVPVLPGVDDDLVDPSLPERD